MKAFTQVFFIILLYGCSNLSETERLKKELIEKDKIIENLKKENSEKSIETITIPYFSDEQIIQIIKEDVIEDCKFRNRFVRTKNFKVRNIEDNTYQVRFDLNLNDPNNEIGNQIGWGITVYQIIIIDYLHYNLQFISGNPGCMI